MGTGPAEPAAPKGVFIWIRLAIAFTVGVISTPANALGVGQRGGTVSACF